MFDKSMFHEKIRHIKIFYGIALSLIGLTLVSSSLLVQRIALDNTSDSRLINIAGRQRMLSQRLVKCVLALRCTSSSVEQKRYLTELESSLRDWQRAHAGLLRGDDMLGLPHQTKSPQLLALFAQADPYHATMVAALDSLLKSRGGGAADPGAVRRSAEILLANESAFLSLMDKITFQFDREAKQRVTSLRTIEAVILAIGLSLLALEFFLVFRPSVLQLAAMMGFLSTQSELLQQEIEERRRVEELLQEQQQQLEFRVAEEVKKNREKDRMLVQNDKMASLGQVAAGVAHEINNPVGYITGNLYVLGEYFELLDRYDLAILENCRDALPLPLRNQLNGVRETLNIRHILDDGVQLLGETRDGAARIAEIVLNLKNFSRMDAAEVEPVLLQSCLKSALMIVRNELKYVATQIREEYEEAPAILGHPGQLSQVFLNLLINAGYAIAPAGRIFLNSWSDPGYVYASVRDTGSGIPDEVKDRILEPFFTTKGAKGTGLGLSISHDIVKRHGGDLLMESSPGKGATFTVRFPRTLEWLGGEVPPPDGDGPHAL
jgi:signal transduction histidine kinase